MNILNNTRPEGLILIEQEEFEENRITHLESELQALKNAIGEMQISHMEEYDHRYHSECNGCGVNLDRYNHEADCPFILAGVITNDITRS